MLTTTFNLLRDYNACERGYDTLAEHLMAQLTLAGFSPIRKVDPNRLVIRPKAHYQTRGGQTSKVNGPCADPHGLGKAWACVLDDGTVYTITAVGRVRNGEECHLDLVVRCDA